jgi:hypothetical protein
MMNDESAKIAEICEYNERLPLRADALCWPFLSLLPVKHFLPPVLNSRFLASTSIARHP